jgi:hypothetical protein
MRASAERFACGCGALVAVRVRGSCIAHGCAIMAIAARDVLAVHGRNGTTSVRDRGAHT